MGALVLAEIPDPHIARAVAADELPLVGVNDYIVDRAVVVVVALDRACASVPDLERAVFGTCYHPFALDVECYACDVAGMAFEGEERVGIGRGADVVELDVFVAGGREPALVG